MFTVDRDPAVESFRTSSPRLVIIEGIFAILIPLSRPPQVPQPKFARKTIFFFYRKHDLWVICFRQVMCTNLAAD